MSDDRSIPRPDSTASPRADWESFRDLVNRLPTGAILTGQSEFFPNRTACEITGYGPGGIQSADDWIAKLFPGREEEARKALQRNRSATPRTLDLLTIRHKDGVERQIEFFIHTLDQHEIWFLTDITGRRETEWALARHEKALLESEARIQAILDTTADAIVTIDSSGIIVQVNRAAEHLFGYRGEELVGRNVSILMPSPHREEHDGYLRRYRETGEAKIIGIGREVMVRRRDGTLFPADLSVSREDQRGLFTGILRDITERKQREAELQARQELTERLIESSIHVVLLLDASGRVLRLNAAMARLSGWTREESAGQDWFNLMAVPGMGDRMRMRFLSATAMGGSPVRGEIWPIATRDGEERAIEWSVAPVDGQGNLLCTGSDVTRRLQLESEVAALAASDERRRTARDVNDDVGSLLTGIQFYVSGATEEPSIEDLGRIAGLLGDAIARLRAIARSLQSDSLEAEGSDESRGLQIEKQIAAAACEERRRAARDLHDGVGSLLTGIQFYVSGARQDPSADNLGRIAGLLGDAIDQLRAVASGLQPIGPEPDALTEALAGLARQIDEHPGMKGFFCCPAAVSGIETGTANHLFRIAQEAVANAIRHSCGNRIVIGLRRPDVATGIELSITDNGAGFPAKGRVDSAAKAGLGLRTMRYRARMVGGALEIARRRPGGTRVTCRLPGSAVTGAGTSWATGSGRS